MERNDTNKKYRIVRSNEFDWNCWNSSHVSNRIDGNLRKQIYQFQTWNNILCANHILLRKSWDIGNINYIYHQFCMSIEIHDWISNEMLTISVRNHSTIILKYTHMMYTYYTHTRTHTHNTLFTKSFVNDYWFSYKIQFDIPKSTKKNTARR